jgi:magnesium-transporting ATPase (P-type)
MRSASYVSLLVNEKLKNYPYLLKIDFTSERKRMSMVIDEGEEEYLSLY